MASALVGVMGLKRSGKDTLAARLVQQHGYTRFALADPMREFALALDPMIEQKDGISIGCVTTRLSDVVARYGWERAKTAFPEVRRTLQRLGTEAGREVLGEDFWVNITDRLVQATPGPVVITDIRFPNEYEWIKANGGHLVRVTRPGTVQDGHASEQMATDSLYYPASYEVLNDSTLDALHAHADYIAHTLDPQDTLF